MAGGYGLTSTGFIVPTRDDILFDVIQDMQATFPQLSFEDSKVETAIANTITNQVYEVWLTVFDIYNSQNPNFASGCRLDILASRSGITRQIEEDDVALRSRLISTQSSSGQLTGSDCFNKLFSDLSEISDVQEIQINLNSTSQQEGVLPPNSYEVMVLGGNQEDVANAIWDNHPVGITLSGNTSVQITDCTGVCRDIFFTRPKLVPIYLDIRVIRTSTNCGCPTDDTTIIAQSIQDYIDSEDGVCFTRIGQAINSQDFFRPVYEIQGLGVSCIKMSRDGGIVDQDLITLKRDEVPFFSAECINIEFTSEENSPCVTGEYLTPPEECTFTLDIVKTADTSGVNNVGSIINYTYVVTNNGSVDITQDIIITDDKATVNCPALPTGSLGAGESVTCTSSYEFTYDDGIAGGVTNKAQAVSGNIFSPCVELTVPYTGDILFHQMLLEKELISGECTALANTLTYRYTITNTGTVPITGQPIINDDRIGGIICPPLPADGLLPNQSIFATAEYSVTQADLDAGEVCNSARAIGQTPLGNLISNPVTVCVDCMDNGGGGGLSAPNITCPPNQDLTVGVAL